MLVARRRARPRARRARARVADGDCAALAREHRDTPMAARTLLQQAVPTTFGLKAAGLARRGARRRRAALGRSRERSRRAARRRGRDARGARRSRRSRCSRAASPRELGLAEPTAARGTRTASGSPSSARRSSSPRGRVAKIGLDVAAARADGGRRGARAGDGGRLLDDAAQAEPGRLRCGRGRRGRSSGRRRRADSAPAAEHERAARRVAGGVGRALAARSPRRAARSPRCARRSRRSRSTPLGCGRTST